MSNVITTQTIIDGHRNVVIKIDGVLDTSDVAATGQIGASGFTTTIGSNVVAFVAGALVPTVGQYLTFSDGTTTFDAGTYVVSITDATHIVVSNVAKATNAAAAITITGTAGAVVIADPAKLSVVDNLNQKYATQLRIDRIIYTVEDSLAVRLLWEATSNVSILNLVKAGHQELKKFGGFQNNAGSGKTGKIVLSTEGWGSGIKEFTITLELVKQY